MHRVFDAVLSRNLAYSFTGGPDVIGSYQEAETKGLNCIALVHLLTHDLFQVELPGFLKSWEMYCDNPYFVNVGELDNSRIGDIFLLGRTCLPKHALEYVPEYDETGRLTNQEVGNHIIDQGHTGIHAAMHTGEINVPDDPILIHANAVEGAVSVWPLSRFTDMEQYTAVHAIKRVAA